MKDRKAKVDMSYSITTYCGKSSQQREKGLLAIDPF